MHEKCSAVETQDIVLCNLIDREEDRFNMQKYHPGLVTYLSLWWYFYIVNARFPRKQVIHSDKQVTRQKNFTNVSSYVMIMMYQFDAMSFDLYML